jgi:GT2 family glycosyltransferase
MPNDTVVCTVFSPREGVDSAAILENHGQLAGASRYIWLANGVADATHDALIRAALRMARPVTLLRCREILPIARAYNRLLIEANSGGEGRDVLLIQDDVTGPPGLIDSLRACQADLPAAWHDDRPPKEYIVDGLPYIVFMAVLIRAGVFAKLGFLNELFIRGVDAEYGCRASNMGMTCGFLPYPRVHHHGKITTNGDNGHVRMIHQQALSLIQFLRRRGLLKEFCGATLDARWGMKYQRMEFSPYL